MKITRKQIRQFIIEQISESVSSDTLKGNYLVKAGDTLSAITVMHSPAGVTVEDNQKLNKRMDDPDKLREDEVIHIYVKPSYEGYVLDPSDLLGLKEAKNNKLTQQLLRSLISEEMKKFATNKNK